MKSNIPANERKSAKKYGLKPARIMTDEAMRLQIRKHKSRNPYMVGVQQKQHNHAIMETKQISFKPSSILSQPSKHGRAIPANEYMPTIKTPSRRDLWRQEVAERKQCQQKNNLT